MEGNRKEYVTWGHDDAFNTSWVGLLGSAGHPQLVEWKRRRTLRPDQLPPGRGRRRRVRDELEIGRNLLQAGGGFRRRAEFKDRVRGR